MAAKLTPEQRAYYDRLRNDPNLKSQAEAYRDAIIAGKDKVANAIIAKLPAAGTPDTTTPDETTPGETPGDLTKPAPPTDEEMKAILDAATKFGEELQQKYLPEGSFGTIPEETSAEMLEYIKSLKDFAATSGQFTPYEQKALDILESQLGGYTSPEVQAMRESMNQELDRQSAAQEHQAAVTRSQSGVRGAAAMAQSDLIKRSAMETKGNIERDLLIKNADEAQRRKESFASLVRSTEDARFGRSAAAQGMYGSALSGEEAAKTGRQTFNKNQQTNENLAQAGLVMSGAGTYAGIYGNQEAYNTSVDQFNSLLKRQDDYFKYTQEQTEKQREDSNQQFNKYLDYLKTRT